MIRSNLNNFSACRATRLSAIVGLTLLVAAFAATPALALQFVPHTFERSFKYGTGEEGRSIAVNEANDRVFILANPEGIKQFDSSGNPKGFTAPSLAGAAAIPVGQIESGREGIIAVDNSANPLSHGRIFDAAFGGLAAWEPSGEPLEEQFPTQPRVEPVIRVDSIAIDPTSGNIWTNPGSGATLTQRDPDNVPTGVVVDASSQTGGVTALAIDSNHNLYALSGDGRVLKYSPSGAFEFEFGAPERANGIAVDPLSDDVYLSQGSRILEFNEEGTLLGSVPLPGGSGAGVAVNGANGNLYALESSQNHVVDVFEPGPAVTLPRPKTGPASDFAATSVNLHGTVDPENVSTTKCGFEWGAGSSYEHFAPCEAGQVISGSGEVPVSASLSGLTKGVTYHYRLVAGNANGAPIGKDATFNPSAAPAIAGEHVSQVHSDRAKFNAEINPEGAATNFQIEYGEVECSTGPCSSSPIANAGSGVGEEVQGLTLTGLQEGTTYHYRFVATNQTATTYGAERTFTTFPVTKPGEDSCPNAHVRQQTSAALLLDCRAYELVSAASTGGYDVESNLVPGQAPYGGYPQASGAQGTSRVLYGVHDGGISGTGSPTNNGVDPYVATRGANGWETTYVGVPADNPFAAGPFSSMPSGSDSRLQAFSFGGPGGCSPCFEGGYTGIPLRLANGQLVQGMSASGVPAPGPSAQPDGLIAKPLSANGEHFIFGSTSQFAPGGNSNGDVSVYDRNLRTEETHVVSNMPGAEDFPESLACVQGPGACHSPGDANGIAELDVSTDGSRILIAQKIHTDPKGNVFWHLYMNIDDSVGTVDLAPGAADGVLFDGMSADGSKVFFSTADSLGSDGDTSADIYEAEVSGSGVLTLRRVSTGSGGAGDSDACEPVANAAGPHWNTVGTTKDCSAVAIAGGGGVASGDATIYFLTPEQLEAGKGIANQPNLYVARPGSAPQFVAVLNPNDPEVLDALRSSGARNTADFQVTPDGDFAVFPTTEKLGDYDNLGNAEIYRSEASSGSLTCVSCAPTNAAAESDATLASDGLSLTDDGRVFFDSGDSLSPRALNRRQDVYEWEPLGAGPQQGPCEQSNPNFSQSSGGCLGLVSTGISSFTSGLLGVSADGTDAFFFTRDQLVPQDENGTLVRIYDARALGGFPYTPLPPLCKASDECHGASSTSPAPPTLGSKANSASNGSTGTGKSGCKKGFVRKKGKCVRRHHHRSHHKRDAHKHHGGGK